MKHVLKTAIILILSTASIVGQKLPEKENDTIIVWSKDRKLNWNDFQRSVHKETKGAQSDIGIDILSIPTKNNKYDYVVIPYFYKLRSSVASRNPDILKHEQLHFDIAELFARKMRIKISQLNKDTFDLDNYNNSIEDIYQNYFLYQEKFDKETGHSILIENQHIWEKEIANELEKTEFYLFKHYNK
jgi:hypothetical protein